MNYKNKLLLLIAISTVLRLIITFTLELSNVEAYYWVFAQHLQWNYFDHPPMVAWLIRLTTANLLLHNEVFVRLGAVISSAICIWLIFKIGTVINNQRTGWLAALLYTSSIYCSISVGAFIIPDSPQMVFWLASILILIKISNSTTYNSKLTLLWCQFGVMSGLCIMSKVHGIFLWLGVVLYALVINRAWLKFKGFYLSAVISLIIVSPIIIWNLQNNFISYQFHISRVTFVGTGIQISVFIKELLGVIVLTNPVNFFFIVSSLIWVFKGKCPIDKNNIQILLFCSLPLIVVLLFISLFRETFPHWPGPAYSCLLILPALKLASVDKAETHNIPTGIKVGLAFMLIITISDIFITNYYPGTISEQKQGLNIGKEDLSLDMYGWKEAGQKFDSLYKSDITHNIMPFEAPIVITDWSYAAHEDFYLAFKTNQQTLGIGVIFNLHQYYWMNEYKKQLKQGDNAYFIVPSNFFNYKTLDEIINSFTTYEMPLVISQFRSGVICRQLYIFRMKGYKRSKNKF